jgi:hypothetical protein
MLGFSHIAWALVQVTRGGGKEKFVWGLSQKKAFEDLKNRLCSSPILSLSDLQHPFEIKTDATDYVVGIVLTQHGHPMEYHSEPMLALGYGLRKEENTKEEERRSTKSAEGTQTEKGSKWSKK